MHEHIWQYDGVGIWDWRTCEVCGRRESWWSDVQAYMHYEEYWSQR